MIQTRAWEYLIVLGRSMRLPGSLAALGKLDFFFQVRLQALTQAGCHLPSILKKLDPTQRTQWLPTDKAPRSGRQLGSR